MAAERTYSLWLMPTGAVAQRFAQLIGQLARRYASPVFPPHVTLVGSIKAREEEMIGKTRELASLIHAFPIRLNTIAFTDAYYRALYVQAEPSTTLLAAYQQARKLFPDEHKPGYTPHLSLLYGDFPQTTKVKMIHEIGEDLAEEFEAERLYLYLTEGQTDTWQQAGTFPLQT
jgi:2'-5' RNA ligase